MRISGRNSDKVRQKFISRVCLESVGLVLSISMLTAEDSSDNMLTWPDTVQIGKETSLTQQSGNPCVTHVSVIWNTNILHWITTKVMDKLPQELLHYIFQFIPPGRDSDWRQLDLKQNECENWFN